LTIVQDFGTWWVDSQLITISLPDADGAVVSAEITLTKPGRFLWCSVYPAVIVSGNDNQQAVGSFTVERFASPRQLLPGLVVESLRMVISKQAGVDGASNISYRINMIMGKIG